MGKYLDMVKDKTGIEGAFYVAIANKCDNPTLGLQQLPMLMPMIKTKSGLNGQLHVAIAAYLDYATTAPPTPTLTSLIRDKTGLNGEFLEKACEFLDKKTFGPVIPVTSVSVSPKTHTLEVGNTHTLSITHMPENATNKGMKWESTDHKIATVNSSGLIRAVAPGTATIKGISHDNDNHHDSCVYTIKEPYDPSKVPMYKGIVKPWKAAQDITITDIEVSTMEKKTDISSEEICRFDDLIVAAGCTVVVPKARGTITNMYDHAGVELTHQQFIVDKEIVIDGVPTMCSICTPNCPLNYTPMVVNKYKIRLV